MKRKLLNFLWVLVLLAVQANAQTRTITGTVTSKDDGLPLPGVTVKSSSSQVGTITGGDGKYSLKVSDNSTITFTFIGYTSISVPVAGKAIINATLTASLSQLNEVVVTGVGTATQKSKIGIDVASVSSKDFGKSTTTNLTQGLTGQVAGAQFIQRTSQPGSAPLIILRGYTNLGSTAPLILIDGVQSSADLLTNIDPSIVDHVEIVKGSAGGMLYGSQGGNGVIQIFTKKGAKNGKLSIDLASKWSRDQIIRENEIVAKYHHYVTDAAGNLLTSAGNIVAPNADGIYTTAPAELPYTAQPTVVQNNKSYIVPTYDHIAQGNRVANTFTNSINVRGGSEKSDYSFGMSNLAQQDVFSNSYNRTNLNLNLGFNPVTGLTFRSTTNLFYTWDNLQAGSRFGLVMNYPFIDFTAIDPNTGRHVVNPAAYSTDGNNVLAERDVHTNYDKIPRLVQVFNLNYKFPKFLELDAKLSEDAKITDSYDLYTNQTGLPQPANFFGSVVTGGITNSNATSRTEYGNGSAYLRTDFKNDFHLNVPVKTTTQVTYEFTHGYSHSYSAGGTVLPIYPPYTITIATTKSASESSSETLYYGYLVNQTIDWANLAGISAGFRSDYSSAFGGASTPFTFPRGTAYFNPSELMNNHDLITSWKLRGAYGKAGVQPGAYDRQVTLTASSIGSTATQSYLITPATARNPNLRVQVTSELEFGTDITLTPSKTGDWVSSITLSGSYWSRTSTDDEQTAPVAPSTGFTGTLDNLVSLQGHGVDLSLDINAYKSKNFDWYVGARFAAARTYVTKVSGGIPITSGIFTIKEGQQLGVIQTQTPLHSVDQLKPDGTRYIDPTLVGNYTLVNGNLVNINNYQVQFTANNDQSIQGNVNPTFTSSLINRFTIYKKLNASFQFDWNHGQKIYNATRQYLGRDHISADFDKEVTINGNTGSYVAYWASFYQALNPISSFVEDGSFVRLRDVSLSYDLTSLVKAKWLKSLVFTVSGRNLLTFSKYSGLDAEVNNAQGISNGGGLGSIGSFTGVDYYGQPNLKSYQFSLNIGF